MAEKAVQPVIKEVKNVVQPKAADAVLHVVEQPLFAAHFQDRYPVNMIHIKITPKYPSGIFRHALLVMILDLKDISTRVCGGTLVAFGIGPLEITPKI